jgi:hypothetical protein
MKAGQQDEFGAVRWRAAAVRHRADESSDQDPDDGEHRAGDPAWSSR